MQHTHHSWAPNAVFYHIYPLGLCGAPLQNDFSQPIESRLVDMEAWLSHIAELGCNALYLGPVFQSSTHGYDTADYFTVDRRLGTHSELKELIARFHKQGMRVILDGVFHHVGRDFWAFKDLQTHRESSSYRDWFAGVNFGSQSPYGDPFCYDGWNGHYNLVKLNLTHAGVREHLFKAVQMWIEDLEIDGLRLDAADVMDLGFLRDLAGFCHRLHPDFFLLGEVIHGDYRRWANPQTLDSTTNYECYKGLYSSHNDFNYFEIAYSLNRLFGSEGIYKELTLYNFADNHDVNRIESTLKNPAHLYPLYTLLFSMPGIPSIYYGSEWGIRGVKEWGNDTALRPALDLPELVRQAPHAALVAFIKRLSRIRHGQRALSYGNYQQVYLASRQFAFMRSIDNAHVVVVINSSDSSQALNLTVALPEGQLLVDLLEPTYQTRVSNEQVRIDIVPAYGVRILSTQGMCA